MSNLINWKELSRRLAGNETSITRNRIPKKYQKKVLQFIKYVEDYEFNDNTSKEMESRRQKSLP